MMDLFGFMPQSLINVQSLAIGALNILLIVGSFLIAPLIVWQIWNRVVCKIRPWPQLSYSQVFLIILGLRVLVWGMGLI